MTSQLSSHIVLPEPLLAFHPERATDRHIHPLEGLLRFGPYSSGLIPDPIRVATISPANESKRLYGFMKELNSPAKPNERLDYLPEWPGFKPLFGLHMRAAGAGCHIELDSAMEPEFNNSPTPHVVLADRLVRAIQSLEARRSEFDVSSSIFRSVGNPATRAARMTTLISTITSRPPRQQGGFRFS